MAWAIDSGPPPGLLSERGPDFQNFCVSTPYRQHGAVGYEDGILIHPGEGIGKPKTLARPHGVWESVFQISIQLNEDQTSHRLRL